MSGSTGNKVTRKCDLLGCSTYVTPDYSGDWNRNLRGRRQVVN